jgi:hypothetical protein
MEERRLRAVMLVQQSMSSSVTLDINKEYVKLKIGGNIVYSQKMHLISPYTIDYFPTLEYDQTDNIAMHVAGALGIIDKRVISIAFRNVFRGDMQIFVDFTGCRYKHGEYFIPLTLEEATKAFVKLKELGYKVVKSALLTFFKIEFMPRVYQQWNVEKMPLYLYSSP